MRTAIATDPSKGTITLESCIHPLENILVSEDEYGQDGKDFAVEVASLSRRVAFQAEPDDPNPLHGGHLIVRHTRGVAQTLTGIEIDNFGQSGIQGTYVSLKDIVSLFYDQTCVSGLSIFLNVLLFATL